MAEDGNDAVVGPDAVRSRVEVPPVRVSMRNYFSTHLLWAAHDFGAKAAAIESTHKGESRFDIEHRAYVIGAVTSAAAFLEAMVNELFQDVHDSHGIEGEGYVAPLSQRTRELMAGWWAVRGEGFLRILEKYQLLLLFADQPPLDKSAEPYQSANLLIKLRNVLLHYKSETVSADVGHRLTAALHGRFDNNRLMNGSKGNPWWPDHALGAGCAKWGFDAAKALADALSDALKIRPNYLRHQTTWFRQ